ncbi:MAG: hypothetical protein M1830_008719 [Pleopsidium flavum]|nr:MAG: hypothetical protein M1830_008719 [Pleopsidium flavum]
MSAATSRQLRRSREPLSLDGDAEDELSVSQDATERTRATPRNAQADEALAQGMKGTPFETLRQLSRRLQKPSTPLRRESSAGPSSVHRYTAHIPAGQTRTPRADGLPKGVPSRRGAPTTPHAIRALQQRRAAALTPGRDRRRSGRMQRETPRDILRNLSKILARNTKPTEPSPQVQGTGATRPSLASKEESFERDLDLPRPRLSMPIDDDDDEEEDDSFHLAPPRLSEPLDDDNRTQQSVEIPRRAISEQPGTRFARESFGIIRMSDRFADLNELDLDANSEVRSDDSIARPDFDDHEYEQVHSNHFPMDLDEDTQDLRRPFLEEASLHIPQSDIRPGSLADDEEEATFAFDIPATFPVTRSSPGPETDGEVSDAQSSPTKVSITAFELKGKGNQTKERKEQKVSRYGIQYSSLPTGVVKKLASTFARSSGNGKSKINKETVAAIMQATDWFLEQVGDDLGTYAKHAGRKTIDETDIITLMKRQRQLNATTTPFSLAQRYLPRELLQDIRMAPSPKARTKKAQRLDPIVEEPDHE